VLGVNGFTELKMQGCGVHNSFDRWGVRYSTSSVNTIWHPTEDRTLNSARKIWNHMTGNLSAKFPTVSTGEAFDRGDPYHEMQCVPCAKSMNRRQLAAPENRKHAGPRDFTRLFADRACTPSARKRRWERVRGGQTSSDEATDPGARRSDLQRV